jgi:hypothetical protein
LFGFSNGVVGLQLDYHLGMGCRDRGNALEATQDLHSNSTSKAGHAKAKEIVLPGIVHIVLTRTEHDDIEGDGKTYAFAKGGLNQWKLTSRLRSFIDDCEILPITIPQVETTPLNENPQPFAVRPVALDESSLS